MVKLGLIRHAKTSWNLEKKLQGKSDIPLSSEGMVQARSWGEVLASQKYDLILSSPMIRAKQTSEIIADKIGTLIEYDKGLREQDFGEWEGRKIKDIRKKSPNEIEREELKGWKFCPPGGEERSLVCLRAFEAINFAVPKFENKNILVVCHNSVIKSLIYKILNRKFLPGESKVLKDYYLHDLVFDKILEIEKLNSIQLS